MDSPSGQQPRRRFAIAVVATLALGFGLLFVLGVAFEGESGALFGALFEGEANPGTSGGGDAPESRGAGDETQFPDDASDAGDASSREDDDDGAGREGDGNIAIVDRGSNPNLVDVPPIQAIGVGIGVGLAGAAGAEASGPGDVIALDGAKTTFAPSPAKYRGRVLDAMNGNGLGGVDVQVSFFRGEVGFANAGATAFAAQILKTDDDGSFTFECVVPDDLLVHAHIQAVTMDRAPVVCMLHGRSGVRGTWDEIETTSDAPDSAWLLGRSLESGDVHELMIHMRYVETTLARVMDRQRRTLPHFPVRVRGRTDSHSLLDEREVEVARNYRYVRPNEWRVMFTDEHGQLFLPFGDYAYDFESLHPDFYFYDRDTRTGDEFFGRMTYELSYTEALDITARSEWRERHRLVDADRQPIVLAEVEIALEGMVTMGVLTDEDGWFQIGVQPYPVDEPPLGLQRPRSGRLTVLASRFNNRSIDVAFPSSRDEIEIPGRAAPTLRFRCVTADDDPKPIEARAIRSSLRMVMIRAGQDGVVQFEGALPATSSEFGLVLSGYLPVTVRMPEKGVRTLDVDLGDIAFERGWSKTVLVRGVDKEALRSASLFVSCVDEELQDFPDLETHRYEVGLDGKVVVGGLRRGHYLLGVEGSTIESANANREVFKEELDKPFSIEASIFAEETVVVSGIVSGLRPEEADGMQVIERFIVDGKLKSMTMPAYPLSSDGRFGSVRRLAGVQAVHVTILGGDEKVAQGSLQRQQSPVFRFGELTMRNRPFAELSFTAKGIGPVLPPVNLAIERNDGLETVARFRDYNGKLRIDNLHRGQYVLRWKADRETIGRRTKDESYLLNVENKFGGKVVGVVQRMRSAVERVIVQVADAEGEPIGGGLTVLDPTGEPLEMGMAGPRRKREQLDPGEHIVEVSSYEPTEFTLNKFGFLQTKVGVGVKDEFPREYTMFREDRAIRGKILDVDGEPFDGSLEISWKPLTPSPITYGRPVIADVRFGRLNATALPGVPLRFTFRPKDGSDSATRTFTVPRQKQPFDIGTVRLGQTRVIRGIVLLPDGSPAKDATVAVLPRDRAYRFPLEQPVDFSRVTHKTTTNVQGDFELEGLPRELSPDMTIVARLDGWNDAVQDPIDPDADSHRFVLGVETILQVQVGYQEEINPQRYRFDLEYQRDPADPDTRVVLGEIPPDLFGLREYIAAPPGNYRVTWSLREAYDPIAPLWEDVFLPDGGESRLSFVVEGRVLQGSASLNGQPVLKGWILLTHDPGENGGTRVGRIVNGQFTIVDAPDSLQAWAAIVPERTPQPTQNVLLGSALPLSVPDYRSSYRNRFLSFSYEAYDLTMEFSDDFMTRNPGSKIFFDSYVWDGRRFINRESSIPIEATSKTFFLMQPRVHRFKIRNKRGSLVRSVVGTLHDDDLTLRVR